MSYIMSHIGTVVKTVRADLICVDNWIVSGLSEAGSLELKREIPGPIDEGKGIWATIKATLRIK